MVIGDLYYWILIGYHILVYFSFSDYNFLPRFYIGYFFFIMCKAIYLRIVGKLATNVPCSDSRCIFKVI